MYECVVYYYPRFTGEEMKAELVDPDQSQRAVRWWNRNNFPVIHIAFLNI